MRLATFRRAGQPPTLGAVTDAGLIDLAAVDPALPRDAIGFITAGAAALAAAGRALTRSVPVPLDSVQLLAPIPQPPELIGVGLNYRDHIAEAGLPMPTAPTVFNKQTSCIAGPRDDILLPRASQQLDYEGELGIVIGRAARNLTPERAAAAIFGYVVVNDLSVRDVQFGSPTVTLGKSFDTHGPFGPWIVTAEDVPNPQTLSITTTVNGKVRQQGNTADMIFSCCDIVAFLSRVMTLQPGTIITTGTPAGVGLFHKPPAFLRAGDVVAVEISGIGRIENRVVPESAPT